MAKLDNQLARMQSLMTYGTVTESKNTVSKNFETRMLGADGKSYAVIRENAKYYIKTAPKEQAALLESYDYIGGWANRKDYEYSSYSNALKNFELKLRSLNEAYDAQVTIETLDPFKKEDLVIEGTDAMKNQIARMRQIMHNASAILNEGTTIGKTPFTSQPESKHANSGDVDAPFTEPAKYEENRDGKKTTRKEIDKDNTKAKADNGEKDTKHSGKRGDEGYKKVSDDLKGNGVADKDPKGAKSVTMNEGCCGNCEAENGTVSDCMKDWGRKDPHSGKVTVWDDADIDEPNLNEENLESNDWGSEGLGQTGVGEVGDNAPFDKAVNEGFDEGCCDECGTFCEEDDELMDDEEMPEEPMEDEEFADDEEGLGDEEFADDEEMPEDDFGEESDEDFADDEEGEDEGFEDYDSEDESIDEEDPEAVRAEIERLQGILDELEGGEDELGDEEMPEDEFGEGEDDEEMPDAEGEFDDEEMSEEEPMEDEPMEDEEPSEEEMMQEAKARFMNAIVEQAVKALKEDKTVLHDFGKHPGYRKKVMSLPQTGADKTEHGEDWNDESVHGEQPFGQKIGSSAPFDNAVKMITDAVVNEIKKKSK